MSVHLSKVITTPLSSVFAIGILAVSAGVVLALPLCTGTVPEPIPAACGGAYSICDDYLTATTCPAAAACNGEYPEHIPKVCLPGSGTTSYCTNDEDDVICRKKAHCEWNSGANPPCIQMEWCQVIYDTPKVSSNNCDPPRQGG